MLSQNKRANANLAMLEFMVKKLGTLKDDFVFLGGCATALFIDDPAVPDVRTTLDVDCIVDVISLRHYHQLEKKLTEQGFKKSIADDVICRWRYDDAILVGQDGWADGRLGDYANSRAGLNDSRLIMDLFQAKMLGKFKLLEKMQELADIDAKNLQQDLLIAIKQNPKKIIVLTHIPPFKEACMHEGKISDDEWMPYFTSKAMGDVLMQMAKNNPLIDFLVLCGHTHSEANFQALNNLTVRAGRAEYGYPSIQEFVWI